MSIFMWGTLIFVTDYEIKKKITIPVITEGTNKILALHGGGETSTSFRNQQGIVDLMNAMPNTEFVFADAPSNNVWIQEPTWWKK